MINTLKLYQDYVVFVHSKALQGRSKAEYLRQVRKLGGRHPERSLKQISKPIDLDHLIYLHDKQKRPSTLKQATVALRLFFSDYLGGTGSCGNSSRSGAMSPFRWYSPAVRENRFKVMLALMYHCGLRVGESVRLRSKGIDSKRGILRVIDARAAETGGVDCPQMIERPRAYWTFYRNAHWLFSWCQPRLEGACGLP
jgi:integrase